MSQPNPWSVIQSIAEQRIAEGGAVLSHYQHGEGAAGHTGVVAVRDVIDQRPGLSGGDPAVPIIQKRGVQRIIQIEEVGDGGIAFQLGIDLIGDLDRGVKAAVDQLFPGHGTLLLQREERKDQRGKGDQENDDDSQLRHQAGGEPLYILKKRWEFFSNIHLQLSFQNRMVLTSIIKKQRFTVNRERENPARKATIFIKS